MDIFRCDNNTAMGVNKSHLLWIHTEIFTEARTGLGLASKLFHSRMGHEGDMDVNQLAMNGGLAMNGAG